jgi:hypothetical protein
MIPKITKPVLFMVFNRPDKTAKVFEQIRKAKPSKLYLSCDAPRRDHPEDSEKVEQVKRIISNVDWECDVKSLIHTTNQGCNHAGRQAFQWVFEHEDEMIELEDDTVPTQGFFWFCQEMLDRYRDDDRIGYITANNIGDIRSGNATYFFSHYGGSWGFATWKRAWKKWDFYMKDFPEVAASKSFRKHFDSWFEYNFWKKAFSEVFEGKGNTYDYQTVYMIFKHDLYNIYPNDNLVTNIGWDDQASNTYSENSKFANKGSVELIKITHPDKIARDSRIDRKLFEYHFVTFSKLEYRLRWLLGPTFIGAIYRNLLKSKKKN